MVGWFLAFICVLVTFGCDDASIYEPVGPTLPISDQRIINQALGTPTMNSSIYTLYDDGNGGFYFTGYLNGDYCIGTIDRNGQHGWIETYENRPRSLYPLSENGIGLTEAVIAVGGIDTDGDDQSDEAYVHLIGSDGVIIDELIISRVDAEVWLNSVDAIGPLTFVAVGGSEIADVYYPFVTTFEINPDSTLEMNNELIFHDFADQYLRAVQVDADQVSGDDFLCYVSARQIAPGAEAKSIAIHAMSGSTFDTGVFDFTWTVEIAHSAHLDIWTSIDCLVLHDGTLYLAGSADVIKISDTSSGYWDAGFVGSVSTSGNLNWINMISISTQSDNYQALYVTGDVLYAAGGYSSSYNSLSGFHYGLALLSMFDTGTGDEIYHLGFGSEEYRSGFNSLIVDGMRVFCGGYTNYSTSGGGFRSWFAEIGIDNVEGAARSGLPVLSTTVKGTECRPGPYTRAEDRR